MTRSVRSAYGLVVRHQRLVWWIFLVNLVLSFLGSLPARMSLAAALDHSLEGLRFVKGFDVTAFALLMGRPTFPIGALAMGSVAAAAVYFVYLLFLDGGIYAVYLDDRKLGRGEFFENCGLYLWRMVRLALYSLVPVALVLAITSPLSTLAEKVSEEATPDRLGFFITLGQWVLFLVLFLFVRMWFDLAQAQVVAANERRVLRTVGRSLVMAVRKGGLLLRYLGIALLAFAVCAAILSVWVRLPHRAVFLSFVSLELVTLLMIAARLAMKAASARCVAMLPTAVPVAAPYVPSFATAPEAVAPTAMQPTPAPEDAAPPFPGDAPKPEE